MPYIGNLAVTGSTASNFRLLDDISSYVWTFDASSTSIVDGSNDALKYSQHRYVTGQRVIYSNGGGTNMSGLTGGQAYYIIDNDRDTIKLAASYNDSLGGTEINIDVGSGANHKLTLAFDGVNKTFKPTWSGGGHVSVSQAAQLVVTINGVVQKPTNLASPTEGFGLDSGGNIVFPVAPTSADVFWGNIVASSFVNFDLSDNKIDNFVGDGTSTDFQLTKSPPTNEDVLVTIDGVTQHPTTAGSIKAYSIISGSVLSFTAPPPFGTEIQIRHIGFAGARSGGSGGVTAFNGRTGNVSLEAGDEFVGVGINSTSSYTVGTGVTMLNFVGAGNTFLYNPTTRTVDISIAGGGGGGSGEIDKQTFNVTANQTVFNLTEKYSTGYIDVYVNGVRLSPADFTETDDDTITLATAAVPGDVVDFVSHSSVVQNTILQSELTNLKVTGIATIANLHVTNSHYGVLGGGEKTIGNSGFASEIISLPYVKSLNEDATISPNAGHDVMIAKFRDIVVNDTYDLTIDSGDFIVDVYDL